MVNQKNHLLIIFLVSGSGIGLNVCISKTLSCILWPFQLWSRDKMLRQVKHCHPSQLLLFLEIMRYLISEFGFFIAVDISLKYVELWQLELEIVLYTSAHDNLPIALLKHLRIHFIVLKVSKAVLADAECPASKPIHPSSPKHAEEQQAGNWASFVPSILVGLYFYGILC